jgi:hypothetical protein
MAWCEGHEGWLTFGTGTAYPACYLNWQGHRGPIWPLQIVPPNYVTVPFDGLRARPPFDDPALEAEPRKRLQAVDGVTLNPGLRPSFALAILASGERRNDLVAVLDWFRSQLQ